MSQKVESSMVMEGTVNSVLPVENVKNKETGEVVMTKRLLWLNMFEDTEYVQTVPIEFLNEKTGLIDKFSAGDPIEVDVNLRGRVSEMKDGSKRCFAAWNGWRVRGTATGGTPEPSAETEEQEDVPF